MKYLPQWIHSIRAWAVFLVFGLLYAAIFNDKIAGDDLVQLITFISGLVLGAYFGKRDTNAERNGNTEGQVERW